MSLFGKAFRIFGSFAKKHRPKTAAIILAAGLGTRMRSEGGVVKQLLLLNGKPIFLHTLLAFDASRMIDEMVLVVRKEDVRTVRKILNGVTLGTPVRVAQGGATRQESARRGLEAVSDSMDYVALHDAARCLITPEMIDRVVKEAHVHRAASAGSPVTDTIKQVSSDGFVEKTLDRSTLFRAQTPQVFERKLYYAATYVAVEKEFTVTDDNMLLEHIGQSVKMVDCGFENIKITTKEDLFVARAILEARERSES